MVKCAGQFDHIVGMESAVNSHRCNFLPLNSLILRGFLSNRCFLNASGSKCFLHNTELSDGCQFSRGVLAEHQDLLENEDPRITSKMIKVKHFDLETVPIFIRNTRNLI